MSGASAMLAAFTHAMLAEYLSFIVAAIRTLHGRGRHRRDRHMRGTPGTNTAILALGTGIASIVGTTGAAMMLIRPLIRAKRRGATTPTSWSSSSFWSPMSGARLARWAIRRCLSDFCVASISFGRRSICGCRPPSSRRCCWRFLPARSVALSRDPVVGRAATEPVAVRGSINFLLIALIVAAILLSATWKPGIGFDIYGTGLSCRTVCAMPCFSSLPRYRCG